MNTEAPQTREWLYQGAQVLAVHTDAGPSKRQWVERAAIITIDSDTVVTDEYAQYAFDTLKSIPEARRASDAILVSMDDTEARVMLFLQEEVKAQEKVSKADLAVSRRPDSMIARRRQSAAVAGLDNIRVAFGDFITSVPGGAKSN